MGKILDRLCLKCKEFAEVDSHQEFKSRVMGEIEKLSTDELKKVCLKEKCDNVKNLYDLIYERVRPIDLQSNDLTMIL